MLGPAVVVELEFDGVAVEVVVVLAKVVSVFNPVSAVLSYELFSMSVFVGVIETDAGVTKYFCDSVVSKWCDMGLACVEVDTVLVVGGVLVVVAVVVIGVRGLKDVCVFKMDKAGV